ncbi:MAG TPA: multidrug efflux SMR transporter [Burkholderiaceae bacterium]|nr:multidrug efflux SMR transporter [Burkholderiaceae bacterium]
MPWIQLVVAGLLEVVWASSLKASQGWTRPIPTVITLVAMAGSFWLLAAAMRSMPLGTAYAIWVGIGAAGAAIVGIVMFGEPATLTRMACVAFIVIGVVGLKLFG